MAGACLAAFGCAPRGQAQDAVEQVVTPLIRRAIPSSGEALPIVGLGTWQAFDVDQGGEPWAQAREALDRFVEAGGRVVDSSPMYGRAEAAVGALAAELEGGPSLFFATKVWTSGKAQGEAQMRQSMDRLRRGKIDLMQVHNLLDVDTHLKTLADWKAEGLIGHVGVTHYDESAYPAVEQVLQRHAVDVLQINYSAAERTAERRLLPMARERGIAVIANRPFAGGEIFARLRATPLPDWAEDIGARSWAQVMLKFVLSHPAMTVAIPGTRNPRHVLDNLGAGSGVMPDGGLRARIVQAVAAA